MRCATAFDSALLSRAPPLFPFVPLFFHQDPIPLTHTHPHFALHLSLHLFIFFPSILLLTFSTLFLLYSSLFSRYHRSGSSYTLPFLSSNILSSVFVLRRRPHLSPFWSGPHSLDVIATCIFYAEERERERDSKLSVYERKGRERGGDMSTPRREKVSLPKKRTMNAKWNQIGSLCVRSLMLRIFIPDFRIKESCGGYLVRSIFHIPDARRRCRNLFSREKKMNSTLSLGSFTHAGENGTSVVRKKRAKGWMARGRCFSNPAFLSPDFFVRISILELQFFRRYFF